MNNAQDLRKNANASSICYPNSDLVKSNDLEENFIKKKTTKEKKKKNGPKAVGESIKVKHEL